MKLPEWLPALGSREEKLRAAHGLTPKWDGWHKSIDGKTRYICKRCSVADAVALLPARITEIRARAAGSPATATAHGTRTVESLVETYVAWLYQRLTTGRPKKLSRRTYDDNVRTLAKFVDAVGPTRLADTVGPEDFARYAKQNFEKRAASSIRREIIYIEALANWAAPGPRKAGLLVRPWFFGTDFDKPADSEISAAAGDSDKAYSPTELRGAFLAVKRSPIYRAAGWLGLNGAFLAVDLATLPESFVDLDKGEIRFPRGKTGVQRLAVLWRPTVLAVRAYLEARPAKCDASAEGRLFRTANGLPYSRAALGDDPRAAAATYDAIGNRWHKLTGLPFSGLRATFATLADAWPDQRAVDIVMGQMSHESIRSRHYAKRFDVDRVRRLVERVMPIAFGRIKT